MTKKCCSCGNLFPSTVILDGVRVFLHQRKYCLTCVPYKDRKKLSKGIFYQKSSKIRTPDKSVFLEIVKNSRSVRECLIKLKLKGAGGNYRTFWNRIKRWGIDTSHFVNYNKGITVGPKKPIECYLINPSSISSHKLRLRLIKEGIKKQVCETCGLSNWRGSDLSLELHHLDGNNENNLLNNLQILCPNCHSQTKNFRKRK